MKSKIYVEILREITDKALLDLSLYLQSKGEVIAFALYEKPDIIFEENGKKVVYYGLVIEAETELGGTKKLYFRKYELKGQKLSDVQKQAFLELYTIIVSTFASTAFTTTEDVLHKLSTTKDVQLQGKD